MRARDMLLAALTSVIWGFGFVVGVVALESFSPAQLTAARFLLACLPVFLVPRPKISWGSILLIGSTLFTGQFLLIFFAFTHGLPPGVASVSQQTQAFFTGGDRGRGPGDQARDCGRSTQRQHYPRVLCHTLHHQSGGGLQPLRRVSDAVDADRCGRPCRTHSLRLPNEGLLHRPDRVGWTLVIGGAAGNVIDRLRLGYVGDYLDLYVGDYHWPTFNVADSAIFIGTAWLLWRWPRGAVTGRAASPRRET